MTSRRRFGRHQPPSPGNVVYLLSVTPPRRRPSRDAARPGAGSPRALARCLRFLRPYRRAIAVATAALLVSSAGNLAVPMVTQRVVDRGIIGGDFSAIWIGALLVVGMALARSVFTYLQQRRAAQISQGAAFDIRNALNDKIQRLSFSFHDRAETGQLLTRSTSDVDLVQQFIGAGLLHILSAAVLLAGSIAFIVATNPRLLAVFVPILCGVAALFVVMGRVGRPLFRLAQDRLAVLNGRLEHNILGIRVVRSFAREPYETERFAAENDGVRALNVQAGRIFALSIPTVFAIPNVGTIVITWAGGLEVLGSQLSIGELVALQSYLLLAMFPVTMLGQIMMAVAQASAGAERILDILDTPADVADAPNAAPLRRADGFVTFDRVSFRYTRAGAFALQDVSFSTTPGQTIALLGGTGSGKSTLVGLIPRFYDVSAGSVRIDGTDVREVRIESLRRQIGIVLQDAKLLAGSVRHNISYGQPDATDADIEAAARAAAAHEFIAGLPGGYGALVGERGIRLSGGQRQRIAIARALLIDPRILILDDSTSSVDFATESAIRERLAELRRNRLSFVIAQRISSVREADLIVVLDQGRVAAIGNHASLQEESPLYVEICASQLVDDRAPVPSR